MDCKIRCHEIIKCCKNIFRNDWVLSSTSSKNVPEIPILKKYTILFFYINKINTMIFNNGLYKTSCFFVEKKTSLCKLQKSNDYIIYWFSTIYSNCWLVGWFTNEIHCKHKSFWGMMQVFFEKNKKLN